jgi:hypothetical protein
MLGSGWRRVAGAVGILVGVAPLSMAVLPAQVASASPGAGYGEGSGFCSSAVPGGYTLPQGGSPSSFDNVYACGPANNEGTGYEVPASGAYEGFFEDSDYEFQCVELANRFVFDIWNLQPISGNSLDGADYASTLSSEDKVSLEKNGTADQPYLPGDIVSFTGSGALADGHVAVVMSSTYSAGDGGNYSVTLLQENASSNGEASATVTDWSMGDPSGSEVTPSNFDALATSGGGLRPAADLVVGNPSDATFDVALSTGSSFSGIGSGLTGWGNGGWAGLADVTGNGISDLVEYNPATGDWDVSLGYGNGQFGAPGSGVWLTGWGPGDWAGLADLTGNGRADLVVHNPSNDTFDVALSTGSSFSGDGSWLSGWGVGDWVGLGDLTGNGRADLVEHNPSNDCFDVATSTGSSFSGSGAWLCGWGVGDWVGLGDLTGNGMADIVEHNPSNQSYDVALSTGSSFSGDGAWLTGWGAGDFAGLGDLTGGTAGAAFAGMGLPDAPLDVTATPANGQAVVTWSAPNGNGSIITGYTVTANDLTTSADGGQTSTAGSTTTCTVTGLMDGNSYSFIVTASNLMGSGTPSSSSTPIALPFGVTTTTLPSGSVYSKTNKVFYSVTLAAAGGNPPYKWSVASGSGPLPPDLMLKSTGVISGKPKKAGTYSFTVQVVDTKTKTKPPTQNRATQALSITIS